MKFRTLILIILIAVVTFVAGGIAAWKLMGGESYIRGAMVDYVRQQTNDSFDFEKLSIAPSYIALRQVAFKASPTLNLQVSDIIVRFSLARLIRSRFDIKSSLTRIHIRHPVLEIARSTEDTTRQPEPLRETLNRFKYKPYPLKSLKALDFVKLVKLTGGVVRLADKPESLIDQINGELDFGDGDEASLELNLRFPALPALKTSITGDVDLATGGFLASVQAEIEEAKTLNTLNLVDGVQITDGTGTLEITISGTDELVVHSKTGLSGIAGAYKSAVKVKQLELDGELFGAQYKAAGGFIINGLSIPFKLEAADILKPEWKLEAGAKDIDLANLELPGELAPQSSGGVDLRLALNGDGKDWGGELKMTAQTVKLGALEVERLNVDLRADAGEIKLVRADGELMGGNFETRGVIGLGEFKSGVDFVYRREWEMDQPVKYLRSQGMKLVIEGRLSGVEGVWEANGTATFYDHQDERVLGGRLTFLKDQLTFTAAPEETGGSISLLFKFAHDPPSFVMHAVDPHVALATVFNTGIIPGYLLDLSLSVHAEGSTDSLKYRVDWRDEDRLHRGNLGGQVVRQDGGAYRFKGSSTFEALNAEPLTASLNGEVVNNKVEIRSLRIVTESGQSVFSGSARLDLNEEPVHYRISGSAADLPVTTLLHSIEPNALRGLEGRLTANLEGENGLLRWEGDMELLYPDSATFTLEFRGALTDKLLTFQYLAMVNELDEEVLSVSGGIPRVEGVQDSILVIAEDLPLERVVFLATPRASVRYTGRIKARAVLSGDPSQPDVTLDAHLTEGVCHGESGYWANLTLNGSDGLYRIQTCDIGYDVGRLVNLHGTMDMKEDAFEVEIIGRNFSTSALLQMIVGQKDVISGDGNLAMQVTGRGDDYSGSLRMDARSGQLGPVGFDRMALGASLSGGGTPELSLDSLVLDWGKARGFAAGAAKLTGEKALHVRGEAEGALMSLLPRITDFFSQPVGSGKFDFELDGSLDSPRLRQVRLTLEQAGVRFGEVIKGIDGITADIRVDSTGRVSIVRFDSFIDGKDFKLGNRFPEMEENVQSIVVNGFDFGVLQVSTGNDGVWMVVPSLMQSNWGGFFQIAGPGGRGALEFQGPWENLSGVGEIRVRNATVTFPFLAGKGKPSRFVQKLLNLLARIQWNTRVVVDRNNRYIRELSGLQDIPVLQTVKRRLSSPLFDVDVKLYVDLRMDADEKGILFRGSIEDTLKLDGTITCSGGSIEYLDVEFDVDKIGVQFNPADIQPGFFGSAVTHIVDDNGIPRDIRLVISQRGTKPTGIDNLTAEQSTRARWDELTFVLRDNQGHTQEELLEMLGYSPETIEGKLPELGGRLIEQVTPIRPWMDFVGKNLERFLGLDRVDIQPVVASNLIEQQLAADTSRSGYRREFSYLGTLDNSRVTVGKYMTRNVYVSYTGSLLSETQPSVSRLGVVHDWDILFRMTDISPNLSLNYKYQYSSLAQESNQSLYLSYSFIFDLYKYRYKRAPGVRIHR